MKNWHRSLTHISAVILWVIVILLALAGLTLQAHGQSTGCPDGADCVDADNFDADLDGWVAESATAEWVASKTLGLQQSDGILHIYDYRINSGSDPTTNGPGFYKSYYLQPGQYRVLARAGQDMTLGYNSIYIAASGNGIDIGWSGVLSAWYYIDFTTGTFTVSQPGQVRIRIVTGANAYFDHVWLEQMPITYPTATPSGPTVTPGGPPTATPIPYDQQATPVPPGTAVCQPGSPPATAIPVYATPSTYTGTTLSTLETFDFGSLYRGYLPWSKIGNVAIVDGNDHTGGESSAVSIQYDPHWAETSMVSFTQALILADDYGQTVWINAWAQADAVPVGETAKMEIWQLIGGTWELVVGTTVSAQNWYPVHAEISASATQVAFVAARSDTPGSGYIMLDDVYLYAPESNAPYCNGEYPPGTIGLDNSNNVPGTQMNWPSDKPCPGGIMQPNNIWGMILAQLTLFLDQQTAFSPAHILGQTRDLAQQFMLGPIGGMIMLATIILDWSVPIITLEVYIAFQAGLAVVGIWKLIRRTFVV